MTGEGRSYKERQQERVICMECGRELERGPLLLHCQTQHGTEKGGLGKEGDKEGGDDETRTFWMEFIAKLGTRTFPIEGCSG